MRQRVLQPPIDRLGRDPERHGFWLAFGLVAIAVFVLAYGSQHVTRVETTEGAAASEFQLVKAFARGGLQVVDATPLPDPATFADPGAAAAAFERALRQKEQNPGYKYVVNVGAADPCPT